jgi:hypothetical protein
MNLSVMSLKNRRRLQVDIIAQQLTFWGRPLSGGQKVSVSQCGSVAKKKPWTVRREIVKTISQLYEINCYFTQ